MKRRGDKTHPCLRPTPTWNGFDLFTINTNKDFRLGEERLNSKQQLTMNAILLKTLQSLSRRTRSYAFLRSTKHVKRSLPYSQYFSKICFRAKIWSVVLRPGRKPSNLAYTFPSKISNDIPL